MGSWTTRDAADAPGAHSQSSPGPSARPADFYRATPVLDRRVHILGVGNVGTFIAHAIRGVPNPPPVTLLLPSLGRLNAWRDSPQRLALVTDGDTELRDGFDAELAIPRLRFHGKEVDLAAADGAHQPLDGEATTPISSLVVCSKAPVVLQGLAAVRHRLTKDSVVLFMQNGMGIVDDVNREIFPDPATRPHYMLGINSHGLHALPATPFTTVHAGFGTIALGILPHERDRNPASPYAPRAPMLPHTANTTPPPPPPPPHDPSSPPPTPASTPWTPNARYLLRTLLRTPSLSATPFSPPDLLQLQLEKLAVNCVINPLSVLLDARNGAILYNYALTRTMRLLLAELSAVILKLPELAHLPNVASRFAPGRLETLVVGVAQRTSGNVSSMLADARRGVQTEVEWLNGWVVRKGEEVGVQAVVNFAVAQLVKGKVQMIALERGEGVPFGEGVEVWGGVAGVGGASGEAASGETANAGSASAETANVETANAETANVETANVEKQSVDTPSVDAPSTGPAPPEPPLTESTSKL
ncbi:ketopantoate reductase PanE/ApbA C terminal-domain-containing protein [Boeremia exigua]|uniref:ketopantoate reductase PanE/ApbA C terminal-domain-containing protein n=1 Tax=Boeremia exigua TaxID=749465 RepID=UPI001E8E0F2C|nr:ketopantoate reductase PanE/ApbA C terminal-domain-containing protein [Boeremia exigua]KAH6619902.1 ketopantoate reductase PanE/ApbA C terminal-domain-containing protein [Boeremia exigua]